MSDQRKIYLDHSATTPVAPEVLDAMLPFFHDCFGNASSVHSYGQDAKVAMEEARREVARGINSDAAEVVFTSGGTEANNWAIRALAALGGSQRRHVITSRIEHHAGLYPCKQLEKLGFDVTYLKADEGGRVLPEQVADAIRPDTGLVSIMHVNNELGTINPIAEIGAITSERGIHFHTDAVQSFGKLPIDVRAMKVDTLALSGHKFYGPKGVGVLFVRKGLKLEKFLLGGRQERDRRAGTENVPAIVGMGKAAALSRGRLEKDLGHVRDLTRTFEKEIAAEIDGAHINGDSKNRLPGIVNVSFPGAESDSLVLSLDLKGIAVSNGSACTSGMVEPSHVITSLNLPDELTRSAVRFSFGRGNTEDDIDVCIAALKEIVTRLRKVKRA